VSRERSTVRRRIGPVALRGGTGTGAFTMIEMIVVVLLIGIVGAIVVPRLVGSSSRRADQECEDVRRLISVAASRSALSGQTVLVRYDGADGVMEALPQVEIETSEGTRSEWKRDLMMPSVRLDALRFRRGTADAQALGSSGWSVMFTGGEPRPQLWLAFAPVNAEESAGWQVEILPEETGASRRRMNQMSRASGSGLYRVDLDAAGQGERAW